MRPAVVRGEQSMALAAEGYLFGTRRFQRLHADVFRTRLLMRPVTLIRGPGAARFLYEEERFDRGGGVLPTWTLRSLQDEGSVFTLAGQAHRVRKALFLGMMGEASLARLRAAYLSEWERSLAEWSAGTAVRLHSELGLMLTRAAFRWAGVPLDAQDERERARELLAMVEHAGVPGPANWLSRGLRLRAESVARAAVAGARAGRPEPEPGTPLAAISSHRDEDGRELDLPTAGVELLNVLRPLVAVGRFLVFVALALHRHPSWREPLAAGAHAETMAFVQEVRRAAPFFPLAAGRATRPSSFQGVSFEPGEHVMLDIFATNRDARLWGEPWRFDPARFLGGGTVDRNALVPQGGGFAESGHRCPGEDPTLLLMAQTAALLAGLSYRVPEQDLRVRLNRIPALPESGFVVEEVRAPAGGSR